MSAQASKVVLIVDDDPRNREYLRLLLEREGHATLESADGDSGLERARQERPDLILLDAMMPGKDGFRVVHELKSDGDTRSIPVIMITALDDRAARLRALDCGAEEFLGKPVDRAELWVRVRNLLRLKEYSDLLALHNRTLEQKVRERSAQLTASHRDTICTIMRAAEFRDQETGAHIKRISFYSSELAQRLGMGDEFVDSMFHASPLHDVGKIAIPDHILLKPGPLDAEERMVMQTHTSLGARILAQGEGECAYLRMGEEIALGHHERWDGSGYPRGLAGDAIPLSARIMAICDVYDALRSHRPYKEPMGHAQALGVIVRGDGRTLPGHFDPEVLDAFGNAAQAFDAIYTEHADKAGAG